MIYLQLFTFEYHTAILNISFRTVCQGKVFLLIMEKYNIEAISKLDSDSDTLKNLFDIYVQKVRVQARKLKDINEIETGEAYLRNALKDWKEIMDLELDLYLSEKI